MGQAAKKSIQRCRQGHGPDLGDLLAAPNCIANAGLCAEDAVERCVNITVPGMTGDLPWLTGQGPGVAFPNDCAEPLPTGLYHDIGVSSCYEVRPKADRQRSQFSLGLRCSVLSQPSINQHGRPNVSEQRSDVPDVHGDGIVGVERFPDPNKIVCTDRMDAVKRGVPIEYRVSEGHPAPRCRWHRHIMEYNGVAIPEQSVSHGRRNVANATNYNHPASLPLHSEIVQHRSYTRSGLLP
jgi:hypothetical protein